MRPLAIITLAASLCLVAGPVHAASGVAMRWDRCYGEGGENNKNFACDTNSGSEKLVISYVPATAFPNWSGIEVIVDALTGTVTTPSWWQMRNAGTCRQAALSVNVIADPSATHCIDSYQGNGAGGIGAYHAAYANNSNRPRLLMAFAVPPENVVTLNAGVEYFACNILINHSKTVGTGACSGCAEPVCLIVGSVRLTSQTTPSQLLVQPIAPFSSVVGWQGGSPTVIYHPEFFTGNRYIAAWIEVSSCLSATPTNNPTWGQIKSLYR